MRGRIVFINPQTRTGLIFGADRERYEFALEEWREGVAIKRNLEVNFQVQGRQALRIKPYTIDYADEPPPSEAEGPVPRAPLMETAEGVVEAPFDDGIEVPDGLRPGKKPLTATGGPAVSSRLGPHVLLDPEGVSGRPGWKFYAIGVAAFLAFLVLAYLLKPLFAHH